jgi:gliding motility-associated-like protein
MSFNNTEHIRGIFDNINGALVFVGNAPLAEYDQALQSVTFSATDSIDTDRRLQFRLNDGTTYSAMYEKILQRNDVKFDLDIPTGFTPNNDQANDTWYITPKTSLPQQLEFNIRIYNKRGLLLFEANSMELPWDGRYRGELLPADSYFYTIQINALNHVENRKGVVTLLR